MNKSKKINIIKNHLTNEFVENLNLRLALEWLKSCNDTSQAFFQIDSMQIVEVKLPTRNPFKRLIIRIKRYFRKKRGY